MSKKIDKPYKLGLALSGGGARGFAHLGALKAMEECNIHPEIISGTSVGALVAVFYADGYSIDEIFKIASTIKFTSIVEGIIPKGGFFRITGIRNLLKKYIRAKTFESLKIPVRVVASDIEFGTAKVFDSGEIISAVEASCSVPIVFAPVTIDGHHYVDGGLLMNFPVSVIREDCERVMGINISPMITMKYEDSLKYIVDRSMNYMVGANTTTERAMCDYLIESDEVSEFSIFDFKHNDEIYKYGYELTSNYLDEHIQQMRMQLYAPRKRTFRDKCADLILSLKSKP